MCLRLMIVGTEYKVKVLKMIHLITEDDLEIKTSQRVLFINFIALLVILVANQHHVPRLNPSEDEFAIND